MEQRNFSPVSCFPSPIDDHQLSALGRFSGFAPFSLLDGRGEVAADFWHQRRSGSSGALTSPWSD
jgi:hypothetical protein